jgi:hypothetical protein
MTSPSPAKGGKNRLKRRGSVKKIFKGQGAAKPKIQKKEISRETIVKLLLESLDDAKKASPKNPRLPLNPRQKKLQQEMRQVMRSIRNLGL